MRNHIIAILLRNIIQFSYILYHRFELCILDAMTIHFLDMHNLAFILIYAEDSTFLNDLRYSCLLFKFIVIVVMQNFCSQPDYQRF